MGALDGVPGGVICERAVGSDFPAVMRREALVTSGPRKSLTTLAALVMSAEP